MWRSRKYGCFGPSVVVALLLSSLLRLNLHVFTLLAIQHSAAPCLFPAASRLDGSFLTGFLLLWRLEWDFCPPTFCMIANDGCRMCCVVRVSTLQHFSSKTQKPSCLYSSSSFTNPFPSKWHGDCSRGYVHLMLESGFKRKK